MHAAKQTKSRLRRVRPVDVALAITRLVDMGQFIDVQLANGTGATAGLLQQCFLSMPLRP
jgi:hypothetical protein